jgi:flagellar biosynthesis/type III secretory pathway protein FliH
MTRRSPFEPVILVSREAVAQEPAFSARSFAVSRAGFLLREFERQHSTDGPAPDEASAAIADAISAEEESRRAEALQKEQEAQALQRRIDDSYRRGREEALAQLGGALDTAISALDEVARGLAVRQQELESNLVAPFTKSAVELAGQLARQHLASPDALALYVQTVIESSGTPGSEVPGALAVHLNPSDIETLKRSSVLLSHVSLIADELVAPGGASLRVLDQVVDDRFESRMREVREAALTIAADMSRPARS